ncbi:MAG: hypothetical protein P8N65_05470 [SAR86 cluster bacterium]|jgi:hypothetical protein|nr:hypothetical protein [SAR86 cluster bacterium]|tara:strand:- start:1732 stop:1881 length:150 start_codon:yes stop_codon:yes gene_type:complete
MAKKTDWAYGDTKLDRNGRVIYFVGYSSKLTKSGDRIELWVPMDLFVKK